MSPPVASRRWVVRSVDDAQVRAIGRWAAAAGLVLAVALFLREGLGPIAATLRTAGAGLPLVALVHVAPMLMNARGWQALLLADGRRSFATIALATWIRESVNGLLPVARIGGEVAAYRVLVRHECDPVAVSAGLVVDMVLSMLSQATFALLGLALAVHTGLATDLSWQLGGGVGVLAALGTVSLLFYRSTAFVRLMELASRVVADRWRGMSGVVTQFDARVRIVHAHRRAIVASFAWQSAGWLAGAGEVWLALHVLGSAISIERAMLIEAFIQSVSSVAFLVPGAVGVQEGAFLLIGTALGIDGPTSLALAATRRLRDLVIFLPGLAAWFLAGGRGSARRETDRSDREPDRSASCSSSLVRSRPSVERPAEHGHDPHRERSPERDADHTGQQLRPARPRA